MKDPRSLWCDGSSRNHANVCSRSGFALLELITHHTTYRPFIDLKAEGIVDNHLEASLKSSNFALKSPYLEWCVLQAIPCREAENWLQISDQPISHAQLSFRYIVNGEKIIIRHHSSHFSAFWTDERFVGWLILASKVLGKRLADCIANR